MAPVACRPTMRVRGERSGKWFPRVPVLESHCRLLTHLPLIKSFFFGFLIRQRRDVSKAPLPCQPEKAAFIVWAEWILSATCEISKFSEISVPQRPPLRHRCYPQTAI